MTGLVTVGAFNWLSKKLHLCFYKLECGQSVQQPQKLKPIKSCANIVLARFSQLWLVCTIPLKYATVVDSKVISVKTNCVDSTVDNFFDTCHRNHK